MRQDVPSKREMKVHWRKVKSSGDDGFSLSALQHFNWLGLLLGKRKVFLPSCWGSKVAVLPVWECNVGFLLLGSVTYILLFGVINREC